jgi:RHH-type proline utilization regulon transcriptional repressor/proline dehydrogenase/delta 1-pyrroline-5-carboxylate dehydrogenase
MLNLDMEHYALRDLTLALTQQLLDDPDMGFASVGIVIQAYLRDSESVVERLLDRLAAREQTLTVRLVKGAYWDYEVAQARQRHWPVPVHERKPDTDRAFERLTQRLLSAAPLVTTAVASHNVRSIAHAMAVAERLGVAKDQMEFQLLYGMGDALHAAIVEQGYPVRIYTPIGELVPGMAYLVRRILENTANESFLRQEFLQERTAAELLRPPSADTDRHP